MFLTFQLQAGLDPDPPCLRLGPRWGWGEWQVAGGAWAGKVLGEPAQSAKLSSCHCSHSSVVTQGSAHSTTTYRPVRPGARNAPKPVAPG